MCSALSRYQIEFTKNYDLGISIPEFFKDISWHNDVAPSFEYVFNNLSLRLWCHDIEPVSREFKDSSRYEIVLYRIVDGKSEFIKVEYSTESSDEIAK